MKKYFVIAFVVALSTSVFATNRKLNCFMDAIPDKGYTVVIENHQAVVSEVTFASPKVIANLICIDATPVVGNPDEIIQVLKCYEPAIADAGYAFDVNTSGICGGLSGVLSKVSIAAPELIANLVCQPDAP